MSRALVEVRVADDPETGSLLGLLEDEHARTILTATSERPMSVAELSETHDLSMTTAYRRVDRLLEVDLLVERTRPRPDGHHDEVYAANLDRVEIKLRDGELEVDCERRSTDMADQLTRLWENF